MPRARRKRRPEATEDRHGVDHLGFAGWVTLGLCVLGFLATLLQFRLLSAAPGLRLGLRGRGSEEAEPPAAISAPALRDLAQQVARLREEQGERERTTTSSSAASSSVLEAPRSCEWERHAQRFLGEFLDGGQESNLLEAQGKCADAGAACAGVTCAYLATRCTARRGLPYLATSPSASEVSFTKSCPSEEPRPTSQVAQPRRSERQPLRPEELLVVVIAHNRPDCLEKCLKALAELEEAQRYRIAVSLDEAPAYAPMEAVVKKIGAALSVEIWHKKMRSGARPPLNSKTPVSRISEHFRFALEESFERHGFEFAVFLENDLLVAPDFLWLFRATAWLLQEDDSLFCVSAWNDNGLASIVSNETQLFRTDYFPGLGWMIRNETWKAIKDEWPRFPSTGWDHWLRHGSGLYPRECIAPEVSRTHHFDVRGTNVKQGTPMAKKLSAMPFSSIAAGRLGDLSYLLRGPYEEQLRRDMAQAIPVAFDQLDGLRQDQAYLVPFLRRDYKKLASKLQLPEAQPRGSHNGIIVTRDLKSQARLYLAERTKGEGLLAVSNRVVPHSKRAVQKALPGESCRDMCNKLGMHCSDLELDFINNCATLKEHFKCEEGCGHQVGQEIPCYVHEGQRDTGKQCLVTDDAVPICSAKNQATTRLCSCVPA